MKKKLLILALIAFLGVSHITVYGHSGGTDSDGGHYDKSTGKYHWHHGEPAHQHYDMDGDGDIDCPYRYKPEEETSKKEIIVPEEPAMPELPSIPSLPAFEFENDYEVPRKSTTTNSNSSSPDSLTGSIICFAFFSIISLLIRRLK